MYDNYIQLAHAIIVQACLDYRRAVRKKDNGALYELEHFFNSEYFQLLTSVDASYIISRLSDPGETNED